jgi:hypothetical protein
LRTALHTAYTSNARGIAIDGEASVAPLIAACICTVMYVDMHASASSFVGEVGFAPPPKINATPAAPFSNVPLALLLCLVHSDH